MTLLIWYANIGQAGQPSVAGVLAGLLSVFLINNIISTFCLKAKVRIPIAGHTGWFDLQLLDRVRFIRGSRAIIMDGYQKFKKATFLVRRIGTDIVVVSPKQVDQIRALTNDDVRSVEPFINDFSGDYVGGTVFLESDLQNRVVQQKLTPKLESLTPILEEELEFALTKEVPSCENGPQTVDMVRCMARCIARISARIFLGPDECRNEEWLVTTSQYTENLFLTGMILRLFPSLLRPLVALILPTYRQLRGNMSAARRLIGCIISTRRAKGATAGENPEDILQWMMDSARGAECCPENLAQRTLLLSLSAIHTTALTIAQLLYDLCDHTEYLVPLRQEVIQALHQEGAINKSMISKLYKLDSILKESQRFSPVFTLTFNRIYHQDITLSDGTLLPSGTRIAVPAHAMLLDPQHVPGDPSVFDGFRYARLREDPANAQRYLFAMTNSSNMAFGYGKYACPGRFYAAYEIKMVLVHLLLRYDMSFPIGCGRPKNFTVDGDMYPDRSARIVLTAREDIENGIACILGLAT